MGLYLLNTSVDAVDPNPQQIFEDLTINDQESIAELIVETILGYENAIDEYDDIDPGEHNFNKGLDINLFFSSCFQNSSLNVAIWLIKPVCHNYVDRVINYHGNVDPPPPKS